MNAKAGCGAWTIAPVAVQFVGGAHGDPFGALAGVGRGLTNEADVDEAGDAVAGLWVRVVRADG